MVLFLSMALAQQSPPATQVTMVASWYGERFRGRPTASGEIYDPDGLTAAHRKLPFGTKLKVTYPATGRSVVVRVNDRGPFIPGRTLDLSAGAAEAIGLTDKGVDAVEVVKLD